MTVASPQSSVVFGQWLPLPEVPGAAQREVQVEFGGDAKEFTSQGRGIEAWAQQVFRSDWVSLEQAAFVNVETERDVAKVGGADLEGKGQEGQADTLGVGDPILLALGGEWAPLEQLAPGGAAVEGGDLCERPWTPVVQHALAASGEVANGSQRSGVEATGRQALPAVDPRQSAKETVDPPSTGNAGLDAEALRGEWVPEGSVPLTPHGGHAGIQAVDAPVLEEQFQAVLGLCGGALYVGAATPHTTQQSFSHGRRPGGGSGRAVVPTSSTPVSQKGITAKRHGKPFQAKWCDIEVSDECLEHPLAAVLKKQDAAQVGKGGRCVQHSAPASLVRRVGARRARSADAVWRPRRLPGRRCVGAGREPVHGWQRGRG